MWASLFPLVTYSFNRLILCNAISWVCAGQVRDASDVVRPLRTLRLRITVTRKTQPKHKEYSDTFHKRKSETGRQRGKEERHWSWRLE